MRFCSDSRKFVINRKYISKYNCAHKMEFSSNISLEGVTHVKIQGSILEGHFCTEFLSFVSSILLHLSGIFNKTVSVSLFAFFSLTSTKNIEDQMCLFLSIQQN